VENESPAAEETRGFLDPNATTAAVGGGWPDQIVPQVHSLLAVNLALNVKVIQR